VGTTTMPRCQRLILQISMSLVLSIVAQEIYSARAFAMQEAPPPPPPTPPSIPYQMPPPRPPPQPKPMPPSLPPPTPPHAGPQEAPSRPHTPPHAGPQEAPPSRPHTPRHAGPQFTQPLPAVAPFDAAPWSANIPILYGAMFDLTGEDQHGVSVEEAYQFPQTVGGAAGAPNVLGYCVAETEPQWSCPLQRIDSGDLRLRYSYRLATGTDYSPKGLLYEEVVLGGKSVWVLLGESDGSTRYRPLTRFLGLRDGYTADSSRMTTIRMPHNTFVTLDRSQREANPSMDIVDYPGVFIRQPLEAHIGVITRVNPRVPGPLHWAVQKLLSIGVANLVLQWLLLGTGAIAPPAAIGAFIAWLRKKPKATPRARC
jgi:hypothetical protein